MALRTFLFLITNLAVVATITLILWLLMAIGWLPTDLPLVPLLLGCFGWGVLGSWISLQLSAESAKRMMGVQILNDNDQPAAHWLVETVKGLADRADLPMPEVGMYESPEWNAFATGPSPQRALVAVSSGILEGMPPQELEAVLAHEMSHVGNGDMVTMTLLQGVINAFVMFLARAVAILLPRGSSEDRRQPPPAYALVWPLEVVLGLAGSLVTAWFSRHREFRADAGAARLTSGTAMVEALERLGSVSGVIDPRDAAALASFKISGPAGLLGLLATHPPLQQRIEALRKVEMEGVGSSSGLISSSRARA
jgi:heat shock protein HtpX